MRVVIVEDEFFTARNLERLLGEIGRDIEVLAVLQSVEESVEWFEQNEQPDLAFLDIHLADGDVFGIFEKVEVDCMVIFTTAYEEYALKAFEVNSIDYLLKPINKVDLVRALDKMEQFTKQGKQREQSQLVAEVLETLKDSPTTSYQKHLLIPMADKLIPLSIADIAYIQAEDKGSRIVTYTQKEYFLGKSLERLVHQLNPDEFYRANRQYIVAHEAIQSVSLWFAGKLAINLKIETPEKVVVSKAKNREFRDWYQGLLP